MVGRILVPITFTTPRHVCEYVTLHDKRGFAEVTKMLIIWFKIERLSWIIWAGHAITGALKSRRGQNRQKYVAEDVWENQSTRQIQHAIDDFEMEGPTCQANRDLRPATTRNWTLSVTRLNLEADSPSEPQIRAYAGQHLYFSLVRPSAEYPGKLTQILIYRTVRWWMDADLYS